MLEKSTVILLTSGLEKVLTKNGVVNSPTKYTVR